MINRMYLRRGVSLVGIGLGLVLFVYGQQQGSKKANDPMSQKAMDEMNKRGDQAMGFDHLKTTHHFRLAKDGGSIEVEANKATDKESRDQIRMHLGHIAQMFSAGNFEVPMLVHMENPPGAEVMSRLKAEIKVQFKETERGGLVKISTSNAEALQGVHDFLRYQIKEHMTGDSLEIQNDEN